PVLEDIPVVGITASEDLTYTAKAFRAGAEFFLPKPFEVEGLLHVVSLGEEAVRRQTRLVRRHQRRSRFPVEIPVRCLVTEKPSATRDVTGHTGNVSIGGLLLLLPEKLASGTVFRLRLRLPGGVIPTEAVVAWQDPQPVAQDRFRHGIKLLRFPEDCDLVLYRRFLSEVAVGHASGTQS
ncbi:MAG: PilZ domain-containing protein, partial [candidate division NC10 bacterium]